MLGLLVFGAATYSLLPVAALPNVDFPTITVSATLPGASPETMASSVATPLEQQFAAIQGLASMNSTSGLGTTSIALQFNLGRNIDGAATDVQTAINAASGLLPKDLPNPPTYRKVNPADRAVLIYAVHSDDMPMYKVDDYAFTILAQKISAMQGVSQVLVGGQQDFAVRIQANPSALAAHGIGLEDVRLAISNATLNQAKGNFENEHQSFTIDTNDQLFQASTYRQIIVAYRNGAPVKLTRHWRRGRCHQVTAQRRLVQRKALRASARVPPARCQHRGDRRQHQDADATPPRLGAQGGAGRAGLRPLAVDPRFR